jgi:F-type H+-transporting ATPase subunit epsilon
VDTGFRLTVLTEEKAFRDGPVLSLIAPGSEGYLGVLRDHAPLVTALKPGKLTVREVSGEEVVYAVSGGYLEVNRNQATLLADAVEKAADIDVSRAEQAAARARERLASAADDVDTARAEAALARALNRLRVARA